MSRIRADQLVNRAGSGGPKFPHGVADGFSVSGIVTATSYRGDGSQLTGIDASSLKDGSNVKVQAVSDGANVTGNVAATGNVTAVDGTFSGNLTVNGTTTTIDTVVSAVDSLQVDGNVGIGTTNATSILDVRNGIIVKDQDTSQNAANPGLQLKHNGTINGSWRHDGRLEIGGQDANATIRLNPNGTVGINSTSPRTSLDIGSTDAVVVPVGTTGQRPGSAAAGMFRYNSTEGKFEGYTTEWGEIGGGGGGLTTAAHVANNAVVTLDLTAAVDHKVTATGICTITCTGGTEAQSHTIRIINSGSATVGFSTYFLFPSGNTPVLTSTDGAINLISFTVNRVGAAGTQLLAGASLNFS